MVGEANSNRNSLLVIDNRDERLISPFQSWLVDEIMANAAATARKPHARWPQGGFGVHHVVEDRKPMCSEGLLCKSSSVPHGFSAVHMAGHVSVATRSCSTRCSEDTGRTLTSRSSNSSATRC